MAKRRTPEEQIEAVRKELEQKQARLEKLLKDRKKQDDKARTHRLCKRGGKVEKLFPRLIEMSEEQFELFVQKTLLTGYAEKIINQVLSVSSTVKSTAIPQNGGTGTQHNGANSQAPKPNSLAQQG